MNQSPDTSVAKRHSCPPSHLLFQNIAYIDRSNFVIFSSFSPVRTVKPVNTKTTPFFLSYFDLNSLSLVLRFNSAPWRRNNEILQFNRWYFFSFSIQFFFMFNFCCCWRFHEFRFCSFSAKKNYAFFFTSFEF
jgi:hypothetical protein